MADVRIYCLLLSLFLVPLNAKIKSGDEYRLPSTRIPYNYKLSITVENPSYSGEVVISFTSTEDSKYLYLHASPKTLILHDITSGFVNTCKVNSTNDETEIVKLECSQPIKKGNNSITISFAGRYPSEQFVGLYQTYYDSSTKWYASTQFEPTYARRVFPCFDEPGFKAQFDLIIKSPEGFSVLANTPEVNRTYIANGFVQTQFETTPIMSTYTLAFVVSQLDKSVGNSVQLNRINFGVYTRPGMKKFTQTALTYGVSLVKELGKWTGITYDTMGNTQLDQVAVVDFEFGAMENWGLIVYRELYILDEAEKTSALQKQRIVTTMAHELAHQWFGNLVTLDWWSDAWLNEGFATFCQYFIPANMEGVDMQLEEQFAVDVIQSGLDLDASASTSPLSSENVETEDQDLAKFDSITYKKGASLVKMMETILGKTQFEKAVQNYLLNNQYKTVNPVGLLETFNTYFLNQTGYNLTQLMYNWVYNPGYPILNVELSNDSKSVLVNQEQFSYGVTNASLNDEKGNKWYVPVTYTTSMELNFTDDIREWLLVNETLKIPLNNSDWIILNNHRKSFYRVNYSPDLWSKIIKDIKSKDVREVIPPENKGALIDDIFASARTGKVDYDTVLDLVDYLKHETAYQPWSAALKGFSHLLERLGDDDTTVTLLNKVILMLLNSAFPDVLDDNSTHIETIRNAMVTQWKCKMGDKQCLSDASAAFEEYKIKNYIDNYNRREAILCYGFHNSQNATEDYKFLLKAYHTTDSVVEKSAILPAIGCTNDTEILTSFLRELISKNTVIKRHDGADVYRAVINSKIGLNVTLTFLSSKHDFEHLLQTYDGIIDMSTLMTDVANKITTKEERTKLKDTINTNIDQGSMKVIGPQVLDIVKANLDWASTFNVKIQAAVKAYSTSAAPSIDLPPLFLCLFFLILLYFK